MKEANVDTANTKQTFFSRLQVEAIAPNAEAIAAILRDRDVAVIFFEVGDGPAEARSAAEGGARALGWKGGRVEIARMTKTRAAKVADLIEKSNPADASAIAWLRRRTGHRVFVVARVGTLCVDHAEGTGFSVAPGTVDREWRS